MENTNEILIAYVKGVEGNSLYVNDFRVYGPKPWGGGTVIKEWIITLDNLKEALG